jgi:hypothetical protein
MVNWLLCSTVLILGAAATPQGRTSQAADPNTPRVAVLVLQPAQLDGSSKKYTLLLVASDLKDGDAAVFYRKAAASLPVKWNADQAKEWMGLLSSRDLPKDRVQAVVEQAQASLQSVAQGTTSKACNWMPDQPDPGAGPVKQLGILLCLKARLEMSQNRCGDAIATIQTCLMMAKRAGEGPTITQAFASTAMAELALQQVAELAQVPGTPNLLPGLQALPRPLVDMGKAMANEGTAPDDEMTQTLHRFMARLDGTVASLQCVEALRHYAATHNGQLPAKLADISDVHLPNDPATGNPFTYRIEGSKVVLETSPPKGGRPWDGVRYEITVAR